MQTAESFNAERTGRIEIIQQPDASIHFLEIPPIPEEALKFIEDAQRAAEELSYGKDAGTNKIGKS